MIQRQGDGFLLDQSRVAYLRYLRREHRHSPRSQADADHVKVKTEMLRLRLMEKRHQLVKRDDVDVLLRCHSTSMFTRYSFPRMRLVSRRKCTNVCGMSAST
jgi:hypothetical protein